MKSRGIRKHGKHTQPVRSESRESYFKTNMADLLGPRCDSVSFRLSPETRVVCGKPLQRYPHYPLVQAYFSKELCCPIASFHSPPPHKFGLVNILAPYTEMRLHYSLLNRYPSNKHSYKLRNCPME